MRENLKIALKRQRKLILIFLVAIVLPSVSLAVFGILAIRNEQFRLIKQRENEQRTTADLFKARLHEELAALERDLRAVVGNHSFSTSNGAVIFPLVERRLSENPLVGHVFILFGGGESLFPLLQEIHIPPSDTPTTSTLNEQALRKAQELEHVRRDYAGALSVYEEQFKNAQTRNDQARMLNSQARTLMRLQRYGAALATYIRIMENHKETRTISGVPLVLVARLGSIECYRTLGKQEQAIEQTLYVYEETLRSYRRLDENALRAHASLVRNFAQEILEGDWSDSSAKRKFAMEVERLDSHYRDILHQWRVAHTIQQECFPELQRRILSAEFSRSEPVLHTKTVDTTEFLLAGVMIPDSTTRSRPAILGVMIRNAYLEGDLLDEIIRQAGISVNDTVTVSTLSGRILYGGYAAGTSPVRTVAFMENNFPPWRIEVVDLQPKGAGMTAMYRSFYFWTILTLIIVLVSGVLLVARTVVHEMEILRIKSDFVSSVSHEFKTPLTSIKALTERLQEGKVRHPAKMKQYFSIIAEDTKRLTQLVGNMLDFSKIEEGKKEFRFEETSVAAWLAETIESYRKEQVETDVTIRVNVADDLPHIHMDRAAMSQAVLNLLENAAKFSLGKKCIDVCAGKDIASVVVHVKDYGIGIPKDEQAKIFDKFYQGRNATKVSGRGTGLGLTLVKHTVEAHGGTVSVASKENEGSTFSLVLPAENKQT